MELIKQQLYGVQFNYSDTDERYRYIQVEAESIEEAIKIAREVAKQVGFYKASYIYNISKGSECYKLSTKTITVSL